MLEIVGFNSRIGQRLPDEVFREGQWRAGWERGEGIFKPKGACEL
jgi:hypothetical protein